ncbi:MAG: hypothetical protein J7L39_01540 [Candidatus Aenigmarchaeota archaeon]|nr:hypothetical protein [Candidatus Aenigmarchaeota archaeon]
MQVALKKEKYLNKHYTSKIQIVYDYIEKYWKKNKSDLSSTSFDLEECFTMLELQFREAIDTNNNEKARELAIVRFRLNLSLLKFSQSLKHLYIHRIQCDNLEKFSTRRSLLL